MGDKSVEYGSSIVLFKTDCEPPDVGTGNSIAVITNVVHFTNEQALQTAQFLTSSHPDSFLLAPTIKDAEHNACKF